MISSTVRTHIEVSFVYPFGEIIEQRIHQSRCIDFN